MRAVRDELLAAAVSAPEARSLRGIFAHECSQACTRAHRAPSETLTMQLEHPHVRIHPKMSADGSVQPEGALHKGAGPPCCENLGPVLTWTTAFAAALAAEAPAVPGARACGSWALTLSSCDARRASETPQRSRPQAACCGSRWGARGGPPGASQPPTGACHCQETIKVGPPVAANGSGGPRVTPAD